MNKNYHHRYNYQTYINMYTPSIQAYTMNTQLMMKHSSYLYVARVHDMFAKGVCSQALLTMTMYIKTRHLRMCMCVFS